MSKNSVRRAVAIASALCVWMAATLQALQMWGMTGGVGDVPLQARGLNITSPTAFMLLDEAQLRDYWSWKRGQLQVDVGINLFTTAGLLGLSWCILVLSPIFGNYKDPFGVQLIGGDADLPNLMVGMFFIGAICPAYSLAQTLGLTQAADMFSQQEGLPTTGLQAMHMAYQIFRGEGMYMFSTQFVFIPVGLCILAHLSFRTGELGNHFGVMGIVTAFFGFITFFLELGTFNLSDAIGSAVGAAFGVSLLFYGIVLLPIWTIWLGIELRRIKKTQVKPSVGQQIASSLPGPALPPSGDDESRNGGIPTALAVALPVVSPTSAPPTDSGTANTNTEVSASSTSTRTASTPPGVVISMTPSPTSSSVVVPTLAPPPRSAQAVAARAALSAFAAPPAPSSTTSVAAATTTPPFSFTETSASPPSPIAAATSAPVAAQAAVAAAPASASSSGGFSNDIDFLSGGLSSSFVAVESTPSVYGSANVGLGSADGIGGVSLSPASASAGVPSSVPSWEDAAAVAVPPPAPAAAAATAVICGNCDQQTATIHCGQCDGDLCSSCNDSIHATGLLKKHKRVAIA